MKRIAAFAGALALFAIPQPAAAEPARCGLTACAHATLTAVQNGPCTGGPTSWTCPWRATWTAGANSSLPGEMNYVVATTSGYWGSCDWLVGGCNPPHGGEFTGTWSGVPCGGRYIYMYVNNTATAGNVSVTASDDTYVLLKPAC